MGIGPHVQYRPNLTDAGWDWCRRAPIVKSMDDPAPLAAARADAVTIFRAYVEYQDGVSPEDWLNLVVSRLQGFRPTYIEGPNEHKTLAQYGLTDYIVWTTEYTLLAHAAGYKVAGFSFPTGNPEPSDWQMVKDAQFAGVDALSIHEYWGDQGFTGWNALRYRQVHNWLNSQHPPFIITECGRDALEGFERIEGVRDPIPGWKLQGVSAEDYAAELAAYDAEISRDTYVIGATVFTIAPSEQKWYEFAVDDIIHLLPESSPMPQPPQGGTMPEYTLGFLDYYNAHPEIGAAVSALMYDANGTAVQYTEKGKLEWSQEANIVYFFAAAG